jgi:predicted lysophospholipase L1 biosynthesis ABC-type transport system permease subunit
VLQVRRESQAVSELEESPAAWSLRLGVLVGVACLLVAILGLLVAGTASWARRARDLAVIRLHGLPAAQARRIALGEQLPVVVVASVAGTLSGLLAAHFSLPSLPILPTAPPVDLLDLSTAWGPVALLAVVPVLALCGLAWALGSLVARRAGFDRIGGAS